MYYKRGPKPRGKNYYCHGHPTGLSSHEAAISDTWTEVNFFMPPLSSSFSQVTGHISPHTTHGTLFCHFFSPYAFCISMLINIFKVFVSTIQKFLPMKQKFNLDRSTEGSSVSCCPLQSFRRDACR